MKAVIWDFDGVLVNSEPLHYQAMRDCLAPEGLAITRDEYDRQYLAYDDREAIRVAFEVHGRPADKEKVHAVAERKARIFEALMAEIPFFEGARELLAALAEIVPMAIASGALRGEIEHILAAGGLRHRFETIVGADDVERGKPHPEPYLLAMQRLQGRVPGLTPAECLVFEDSMAGITSGLAAGMKVVGVAQTFPAHKLTTAHLVVPSLRAVELPALRALFS
jgi:HAD superfamily hydrolase (TIGR01509 family)